MERIQFLYGKPDRKIKYYYVVANYDNGVVFWCGNKGCAGWTTLEYFVECVKRGECKTVVIMEKDAEKIKVIEEAFNK